MTVLILGRVSLVILVWMVTFCFSQSISIFSAQFSRFNPFKEGGGVTTGSIWYDAVYGGIKITYSPNQATEWYRFTSPRTGKKITTTCTSNIVETPISNQTWESYYSFPFQTSVSAASSTCEPGSSSLCTVGTRITAIPGENSITYNLDRSDANCGCTISNFYLNVPPCASCVGITVASTTCPGKTMTFTCGNPPSASMCNSLTGINQVLYISAPSDCFQSFKVTMPGAYANPGPVGLSSSSPQTCTTCPSVVFTCDKPFTGLTKYKNANTGCPCEPSDIKDNVFWSFNTALFLFGNVDDKVTYNSKPCRQYTKAPTTVSNVTTMWIEGTSNALCQFILSSGDIYTLSNYQSYSTSNFFWFSDRPTQCSYCQRPVDLVFIAELSSLSSIQETDAMQSYIKSMAYMFFITPQTTNMAIISLTPSGPKLDLPLKSGYTTQSVVNGASGGLVCDSTGSQTGPCYAPGNISLAIGINMAASELSQLLRPYTSKNIFFITSGAWTDSLSQVTNALRDAQQKIGSILNFYSLALTRDPVVVQRLNQIKQANDILNFPLTKNKVVNRVYWRGHYSILPGNVEEVVSGVCAGNGDASCGNCCGDCTCGTTCVAPTVCKPATCFTVSLTLPISTSTCCDYKPITCPPVPNLCTINKCDFKTGNCSLVPKSCPISNQCYKYICNNKTGDCDQIPLWDSSNKCRIPSCSSGTIEYTNKVCPKYPCKIESCDSSTGECVYKEVPQNPPDECSAVISCDLSTNNSWIYSKCPAPTCYTSYCTNRQCSALPNCVSDLCTNRTCLPNGTCKSSPMCPPLYISPDGIEDPCRSLQYCDPYFGCQYTTKTCSNLQNDCEVRRCNATSRGCDSFFPCDMYPMYNATTLDYCRPRLSCALNSNGKATCNYRKTSNCDLTTGTCSGVPVCPPYKVNSTGGIDKCMPLTYCDLSDCIYTKRSCLTTEYCNISKCNPSTGNCDSYTLCPPYLNGSLCRPRTNCNISKLTCEYSKVDVNLSGFECVSRTKCERASCDNSSGACIYSPLCPAKYTEKNTTYQCLSYTGCGPEGCIYSDTSGCKSIDCKICNNRTGSCDPINWCPPIFEDNECKILDKCYGFDNCTYKSILCDPVPLCQESTCDPKTGLCKVSNKTGYNWTANCPNNPCLIPYFDLTQPTCCGTKPKCSTSDLCQEASCTAGKCSIRNKTCPLFEEIGTTTNMCRKNNGCRDGTCTYEAVTCAPSPDPCFDVVCHPKKGCVSIPSKTVDCPDLCKDVLCPDANCTKYACNAVTGACEPTGPVPSCVAENFCIIPKCNVTTNTCIMQNFNVSRCPELYGKPKPCTYWGMSPYNPGCCQLLPICNQQVDTRYLCMKYTCLESSNTCQLSEDVDKCDKYQFPDDSCRPLIRCENSTGACIYDDYNQLCQKKKPKPCQNAYCDPKTGDCIFVDTIRCQPNNPCANVTCPSDLCQTYTCNATSETTYKCVLTSQKTCTPPNICTLATCESNSGCQYTPFSISKCGTPPPCMEYFPNSSKYGCCDLRPKCPQLHPDPLCHPTVCREGNCEVLGYDKVCPPYKNESGVINYCRKLIDCMLGTCVYQDTICTPSSSCRQAICNTSTGLCHQTDICPNNLCVNSFCDDTTGNCTKTASVQCDSDYCTKNTCSKESGNCQPYSKINISSCPPVADGCMEAFLDPTKPSCCSTRPKCRSSDPCVISTCVNHTCHTRSLCPTKTCSTTYCNPRNASCTYKPIQCEPINSCFEVPTCVEGKPFQCTQILKLCPSDNKCLVGVCNPEKHEGDSCDYFNKSCDIQPCTNGVCDPATGRCSLVDACVSSDPCISPYCNETGECVFPPLDCDDKNACTVDTCFNGTCVHSPRVCNDFDNCTDDSCSATLGCLFVSKNCENATLPCLNTSTNSHHCKILNLQCGYWTCNSSIGCIPVPKQCNLIAAGFTVAVAAGTSAGIIAALVIGIVAALVLAGGGSYAAFSKADYNENEFVVTSNPLYVHSASTGSNPLYKPLME